MSTMSSTSNLLTCQFAVDLKAEGSQEKLRQSLEPYEGEIKSLNINAEKSQLVIESSLPSGRLHEMIESSGCQAVLLGQGSKGSDPNYAAAAVSIVSGEFSQGVVRFLQVNKDDCVIDGTVDGLSPGRHGLHVHEYGDLSNGCQSTGPHFNPTNSHHGDKTDNERHAGDLGNIDADEHGRAVFRFSDHKIKVWDIIGRSLVIDQETDGGSLEESHLGQGIACGIIARSAGMFENQKKICNCSGKTLWQERADAVAANKPTPS